jgi:hypothetical protein
MDFPGRIARGDAFARVIRSRPAPVASGEPAGTLSQTVDYLDNNWRVVARVHQYRRADGTLGASGLPDPKKLVVDGVELVLDPDPSHACPNCARAGSGTR